MRPAVAPASLGSEVATRGIEVADMTQPNTTRHGEVTSLTEARRRRELAKALDAYIAASEYVFQSIVAETQTTAPAKPAGVEK